MPSKTEATRFLRPLLGQVGEALAAEYLIRAGFVIIERNYRCLAGEMDLIAMDRGDLVFVEVRTRSNGDCGHPLESIDFRKQSRLRRIAAAYLCERSVYRYTSMRFDAVGIIMSSKNEPTIDHVQNAICRGLS